MGRRLPEVFTRCVGGCFQNGQKCSWSANTYEFDSEKQTQG